MVNHCSDKSLRYALVAKKKVPLAAEAMSQSGSDRVSASAALTLTELLDRHRDLNPLVTGLLDPRSLRIATLCLSRQPLLELNQAAFDRLLWSAASPAEAAGLARRIGHERLHPILQAGLDGWGIQAPDGTDTAGGTEAYCERAFRGNRLGLLAWARANGCPWAGTVRDDITALVVPDGVVAIRDRAFSGCQSLSSITLPTSLEALGRHAFEGCTALGSIALPPTLRKLGYGAFTGCHALRALVLPDGLRVIQASFEDCPSLHTVFLPAGLSLVSGTAFLGCGRLRAVWAQGDPPADLMWWVESALPARAALLHTRPLARLDQPAFDRLLWSTASPAEAAELARLIGHEPLHRRNPILAAGFQGWEDDATGQGEGEEERAASGTEAYCERAHQQGHRELLAWARANDCPWSRAVRERVTALAVPDGVFRILGGDAFSECVSLRSITLPPSLQALGDDTFFRCWALESVRVPSGVRELGQFTFAFCRALRAVELPPGLTTLGMATFLGCVGLREVVLPDRLTTLGSHTFSGCLALQRVFLPKGLLAIPPTVFSGCSALRVVGVPIELFSNRCLQEDILIALPDTAEITHSPASEHGYPR